MEDSPMDRGTPYRNRTEAQRDGARLDQLLRSLPPDRVEAVSQTHRRVPGALGDAEVQTTEGPPRAGLGVSSGRVLTRAGTLCSLAAGPTLRPEGGSRMTGDCHVRFCE